MQHITKRWHSPFFRDLRALLEVFLCKTFNWAWVEAQLVPYGLWSKCALAEVATVLKPRNSSSWSFFFFFFMSSTDKRPRQNLRFKIRVIWEGAKTAVIAGETRFLFTRIRYSPSKRGLSLHIFLCVKGGIIARSWDVQPVGDFLKDF